MNRNKEIWEGWTVQDFIDDVDYIIEMIMKGQSIEKKFENKEELKKWLREHQSNYKKDIPEVIEYFTNLYNLK